MYYISMLHKTCFEVFDILGFYGRGKLRRGALGSALAARLLCLCILASVPAEDIYQGLPLPHY